MFICFYFFEYKISLVVFVVQGSMVLFKKCQGDGVDMKQG